MQKQVTIEEWVTRFRAIGLDVPPWRNCSIVRKRRNPSGHKLSELWVCLRQISDIAVRTRNKPARFARGFRL